MTVRFPRAVWPGILALGIAGCTGAKPPCTIIPAQLELARTQRDRAKASYETKLDDVERQKGANQVSDERLVSLLKERDELKQELAAAGADTVTKAGAK